MSLLFLETGETDRNLGGSFINYVQSQEKVKALQFLGLLKELFMKSDQTQFPFFICLVPQSRPCQQTKGFVCTRATFTLF